MTIRKARLTFAGLAVLVAAGVAGAAVAAQSDPTLEPGPTYSLEGAWYGTVTVGNEAPVASLDAFTSDARNQGVNAPPSAPFPR